MAMLIGKNQGRRTLLAFLWLRGCAAFVSRLDVNRHRRVVAARVTTPERRTLAPQKSQSTPYGEGETIWDRGVNMNRRRSIAAIFSTGLTWSHRNDHQVAVAASEVRAPLELLRPATRVKLYIDQSIHIATSSTLSSDDRLQALQQFFAKEPVFMTTEEERLSRQYLEIDTSRPWQAARLRERETRGATLGIDYTTPYDKFNTAVQQWGDRTQFRILRGRQRNLERSSAMRAALNAYTNNLVFGDAYQLNVDSDTKKALVRNDALPNVDAVVVSDLDLRDLIRNQVLQNMDDARAELDYQVQSGDVDVNEIVTYLKKAQDSCAEWFSFIPREDVEEALRAVDGVYSVS